MAYSQITVQYPYLHPGDSTQLRLDLTGMGQVGSSFVWTVSWRVQDEKLFDCGALAHAESRSEQAGPPYSFLNAWTAPQHPGTYTVRCVVRGTAVDGSGNPTGAPLDPPEAVSMIAVIPEGKPLPPED